MENFRFTMQENQYWGECVPCTPTVFNKCVDDPKVARKIELRRAVDKAIQEGLSLDSFTQEREFMQFCTKKQGEKNFAILTTAEKLLQWTNSLKSSLPCFIFGVTEFEGTQRKQAEIKHLSGLFMFDADHLTCDPEEVYKRALAEDFPWKVRLAHKTSSGYGLRLVCEWRTELGNIADNQICLARDLHLMGVPGSTGKPVVDDSCIDATRISYCPQREDIYFIDENELYNNQSSKS